MPDLTFGYNKVNVYLRGSDSDCDREHINCSTYSDVAARVIYGAIIMQLTEFCHSYNIDLSIESDWEG